MTRIKESRGNKVDRIYHYSMARLEKLTGKYGVESEIYVENLSRVGRLKRASKCSWFRHFFDYGVSSEPINYFPESYSKVVSDNFGLEVEDRESNF
jgi:hypothetical protein